MSNDLVAELAFQHAQRGVKLAMANDEEAKKLNPPAVTGGGDATPRTNVEVKGRAVYVNGVKKSEHPTAAQAEERAAKWRKGEGEWAGDAENCDLLVVPDAAKDHAFTVGRIGVYQILEGAGTDGGAWFAKGRGETKRFTSRRLAEEHAEHSSEL